MCLSNNQYQTARIDFDDTILLGLEVLSANGVVEHVLGYYNTVAARKAPGESDRKDFGWKIANAFAKGDFGWKIPKPIAKVGNAMLFAVPAKAGTVNLVPVGKYPHFMEDYKRAVMPPESHSQIELLSYGSRAFSKAEPIVIKGFDGGTYDVVISPGASLIPSQFAKIEESKRPVVNTDLYAQLDILYPGFTFVLFCFSEECKSRSGCALIKYQPLPELDHLLFLPGLDGHNGSVESGDVVLNHTIVVGSYRMSSSSQTRAVNFTDQGLKTTCPFLLDKVIGRVLPSGTKARQGDFLFSLDEIRGGTLRAKRELPPGWNEVFNGYNSSLPQYIRQVDSDFDFGRSD